MTGRRSGTCVSANEQVMRSTRRVVDRELLEPAEAEVGLGHLVACDREHRIGRVDADHAVTQLDEPGRMAAGAARGVERDANAGCIEHRVHQWLLRFDGWVRAVVASGPDRVALVDVVLDHRDRQRVREVVHGCRYVQNLVDPRRDGRGVAQAEAGERQPFDAQEVVTGEDGVRSSHGRFLAQRTFERTWIAPSRRSTVRCER